MPRYQHEIRALERGTQAAGIAVIWLLACRLIQLIGYYDPRTGIWQSGLFCTILNVLTWLGAAIALWFCWRMAGAVRNAGELSMHPVPINGIGMLIAGGCFLVDGISGTVRGLTSEGYSRVVQGFMRPVEVGGVERLQPNYLWIALVLLTFGSGIVLLCSGIRILTRRGGSSALQFAVLVLWGCALLVHQLMTYPDAVAMQSDNRKTIIAALVLAYALDLAEQYTADGAPDTMLRLLLRLCFPVAALAGSLPYLAAGLFGIRDAAATPYLSLVGLGICAGISALQIAISAVSALSRRRRLEQYQSQS